MTQRKEFDFSKENLELVNSLLSQGMTYKQVARKLNKDFCTKVKHKNLSNRTIANLLQAFKQPVQRSYTDSDKVYNPEPQWASSGSKLVDKTEPVALTKPEETNSDIIEIMACNLSEALKVRCCKLLLQATEI